MGRLTGFLARCFKGHRAIKSQSYDPYSLQNYGDSRSGSSWPHDRSKVYWAELRFHHPVRIPPPFNVGVQAMRRPGPFSLSPKGIIIVTGRGVGRLVGRSREGGGGCLVGVGR